MNPIFRNRDRINLFLCKMRILGLDVLSAPLSALKINKRNRLIWERRSQLHGFKHSRYRQIKMNRWSGDYKMNIKDELILARRYRPGESVVEWSWRPLCGIISDWTRASRWPTDQETRAAQEAERRATMQSSSCFCYSGYIMTPARMSAGLDVFLAREFIVDLDWRAPRRTILHSSFAHFNGAFIKRLKAG